LNFPTEIHLPLLLTSPVNTSFFSLGFLLLLFIDSFPKVHLNITGFGGSGFRGFGGLKT